eukprot:s87_g35.t1
MAGEQSYGDTWVNVSFSMSPEGVEEIFEIMTKVVPEQPFENWTLTWSKVRTCLNVADEWACAQGRADHRRILKRLSSLLLYGEWGATPLDVPPHPKIAGARLMAASYEEATSAWSENFAWNQRYLVEDLLRASKVLTVLAWHLSLRANRKREFEWCRSGCVCCIDAAFGSGWLVLASLPLPLRVWLKFLSPPHNLMKQRRCASSATGKCLWVREGSMGKRFDACSVSMLAMRKHRARHASEPRNGTWSAPECHNFFQKLQEEKKEQGTLQWATIRALLVRKMTERKITTFAATTEVTPLPLSVLLAQGWEEQVVKRFECEKSESYGVDVYKVPITKFSWKDIFETVEEKVLQQEKEASKKKGGRRNKDEDMDVPEAAASSGKDKEKTNEKKELQEVRKRTTHNAKVAAQAAKAMGPLATAETALTKLLAKVDGKEGIDQAALKLGQEKLAEVTAWGKECRAAVNANEKNKELPAQEAQARLGDLPFQGSDLKVTLNQISECQKSLKASMPKRAAAPKKHADAAGNATGDATDGAPQPKRRREDCRQVIGLLRDDGAGKRTGTREYHAYPAASKLVRQLWSGDDKKAKVEACPLFARLLSDAWEKQGGELTLVVFSDDATPGNILAARQPKKSCMMYCSFLELPVLFQDSCWIPLSNMRVNEITEQGYSHAEYLRCVLEFVHATAQDGMAVTLRGGSSLVWIRKVIVLGDHEGLRAFAGCKGAAGLKPCWLCCNVISGQRELPPNHVHLSCADTSRWCPQTDDGLTAVAAHLRGCVTKKALQEAEKYLGWRCGFNLAFLQRWMCIGWKTLMGGPSPKECANEKLFREDTDFRGDADTTLQALPLGGPSPKECANEKLFREDTDFRGDADTTLQALPLFVSFSKEMLADHDGMQPANQALWALHEEDEWTGKILGKATLNVSLAKEVHISPDAAFAKGVQIHCVEYPRGTFLQMSAKCCIEILHGLWHRECLSVVVTPLQPHLALQGIRKWRRVPQQKQIIAATMLLEKEPMRLQREDQNGLLWLLR